jgi:DNA-binding SARP family transcriptional activator
MVKIGAMLLEHGTASDRRVILDAIARARDTGALPGLRWWLRRYVPHAQVILREKDGPDLLSAIALADPEGWRGALLDVLGSRFGSERAPILATLGKLATRQTTAAMRQIPGSDVAEMRRSLIQQQAPRLYVRSFGPLSIHRGSWTAPPIAIEKKRTRTLLGLLVANVGGTLTREMVLDILWPDADPSAAANSLNQTAFQLRRAIDPDYRDGESANYITSNVDLVQLNPDLVVTDLEEFRRISPKPHSQGGNPHVITLIEFIRGEFLAELRYEDWATRAQTAVHTEVRAVLLPLANGKSHTAPDVAVRAACALLELDPFDESAQLALAAQLTEGGRPAAARLALNRFARRLEEEDLGAPTIPELADLIASAGKPSQRVQ